MRVFGSGTPQYEGDGQPKANCKDGLLGWFASLLGFPCSTPEYDKGEPEQPSTSDPSRTSLDPSPEGYGEPMQILITQT